MKIFRKKNKDSVADHDLDSFFSYPVGAPIIAGGDKIYAIYCGLILAKSLHKAFYKGHKHAKDLDFIVRLWDSILQDIDEYGRSVISSNSDLS